MPITVKVTARAKGIVAGVQKPAAKASAVGRHHRDCECVAGELENADPPWAGDQDLCLAITVKVTRGTEMVVVSVEKPAAKARAVGSHHQCIQSVRGELQKAHPPWAGDQDFCLVIAVVVSGPHSEASGVRD